MIEDLEDRYSRAKSARTPYERRWVLGVAYYFGNQWCAIDGTGRLYEPQLDPNVLKLVDNRIQPAVLMQVAKMTKQRPIFTVVPRSGDEEDVRGALMGERVLDWAFQYLDLVRKRRAAILWSRVAAAGFWKVCWDPQKGEFAEVFTVAGEQGPQILLDANERPLTVDRPGAQDVIANLDDERRASVATKRIGMGDLAVHLRSPFEMYVDPLADDTGLESAGWVIEETIQSTHYMRERFDVELEPDALATPGILETRMPGAWASDAPPKEGVRVREMWAPSGSEFANGKKVVWANDKVVREEDNPYGWLPYSMFRGTPVPGRFWPTCFTEQAISPQTELNKVLSTIAENGVRIGNPPLLKSRQAKVEWSGLVGEEIEYDDTMPNSVPSFLAVPEIPMYVQNRVPQLIEAIAEQSGQHDVSRGNVPVGVTAAAAINLLQEADDTRLGPDIEDMEVSLADAGGKLLELAAKFYSDQRVIKLAGEEGEWDIFEFKGSMLRGNTDVQVQAGSAMPRSKAAKQAAMQEVLNLALQYGVELNQRSLRKFFTDYEVGGLERLFGDIDHDERKVRRENRRLAAGIPVPVQEWENHELEIEAHNEFRKTVRYEQLDPAAKMTFEEHVRAHQQALQTIMQSMASLSMPPAGATPPNGNGATAPPTIPIQ